MVWESLDPEERIRSYVGVYLKEEVQAEEEERARKLAEAAGEIAPEAVEKDEVEVARRLVDSFRPLPDIGDQEVREWVRDLLKRYVMSVTQKQEKSIIVQHAD